MSGMRKRAAMTNEQSQSAVERLQMLLNEYAYTPEQIAETAIHSLYPTLSEGAANTFQRLGRGAVLMDLRELAEGKLNTSYVPAVMIERLHSEAALFGDALVAIAAYDPEREYVAIVWQRTITIHTLPRI